ncbi:MAG: hypothetical protein IKG30_10050 [Clostridiales bacterium]|nr:hypothetical protein [Clostridiales bacterium]
MNDLLPNLIARRDELIQLKKNAELRLQNLNYKGEPEYHIRVDSSKNQFYIIGSDNNTKRKYLSSKKTESAQQIASYEYLKSVLKRIDTELAHIEKLIKFCINTSPEAYYESLSKGRQKLINPIRLTDEQFIEKWMSESYVGCEFEEGDSEFYTDRNERVRSK